ncbi:iron-sulfur cluster assembly 1 homolog, mitochondrial isoform X8 [Canis lupus familiaris]|uniref:iron-sulfur cluster assembly 1 homolog, mitochondrial isoform X8 n=1 Tax=Canis lupus familiaris TaxID=9615 RepID=UPI0018F77181|nr:iron-sulfur cluster assembly 1 homolog, mitochondrial isoform X8 [Canis lupus familiaris]
MKVSNKDFLELQCRTVLSDGIKRDTNPNEEDEVAGVSQMVEKQFMDLRDLEWRYYKGIVKWKHSALDSFIDIKHDDEKRFVESREMPGVICPPILHGSLVIYPQVDYQKKM